MFVVLMQWVLKFIWMFIDFLCPGLLIVTPENPTFHIFCFDDENPIAGDDNMVDLCRAIIGGKRHILN